jgi:hypothetical protein
LNDGSIVWARFASFQTPFFLEMTSEYSPEATMVVPSLALRIQ